MEVGDDSTGPSDAFSSLLVALQGVRILEKPRVSREVIIFVLKEHTEMMREFKTELNAFSALAENLVKQTDENKNALHDVAKQVENNRASILALDQKAVQLQNDLSIVQEKIAEVAVIKQSLKETKIDLKDCDMRLRNLTSEMKQHAEATGNAMTSLEIKTNDAQFQVKELKHRVDHFGDNLTLSSNQIVVESGVGFSKKPMALTDILKQCNENFGRHEASIVKQTETIAANSSAIESKADATILMTVEQLQTGVDAIKDHIKKEEKQGVNSLRRICDELTVAVEAIQSELSGKMDRNSVDVIIHRKYEDIVEYLQEALQAAAEDEDNFKSVSNQLQETVNKLMGSKADRLEIQPMQEALVKFESILLKLGVQTKDKGRGSGKDANGISRQEVQSALDLKMDKTEFDAQMIALTSLRREKRAYPTMGVVAAVEDAALLPLDASRDKRDALMWKGLADAMKEESEEALARGVVGRRSGDATGTPAPAAAGAVPRSRQRGRPRVGLPSSHLHQSSSTSAISADLGITFPATTPGKFRQPSEGGKPGGQSSGKDAVSSGIAAGSSNTPSQPFLPPAQGAKGSAAAPTPLSVPRAEGNWPAGKIWEHGRDPANAKLYDHVTDGSGPARKPKSVRRRRPTSAGDDSENDSDSSANESDGHAAYYGQGREVMDDYTGSDRQTVSPATEGSGGVGNADTRAPVLGGGFSLGAGTGRPSVSRRNAGGTDIENEMVMKGTDKRLYFTDEEARLKGEKSRVEI